MLSYKYDVLKNICNVTAAECMFMILSACQWPCPRSKYPRLCTCIYVEHAHISLIHAILSDYCFTRLFCWSNKSGFMVPNGGKYIWWNHNVASHLSILRFAFSVFTSQFIYNCKDLREKPVPKNNVI